MRDVTFGEDACPITKGQGPEYFTLVRNLAMALLHQAGYPTLAAAMRSFSMNPDAIRSFFCHPSHPYRPASTPALVK